MMWIACILMIISFICLWYNDMVLSDIPLLICVLCMIPSLIITLNWMNTKHTDNCICEECQPKMIREYCPCGCGQYEIKYQ